MSDCHYSFKSPLLNSHIIVRDETTNISHNHLQTDGLRQLGSSVLETAYNRLSGERFGIFQTRFNGLDHVRGVNNEEPPDILRDQRPDGNVLVGGMVH